MLHYNGLDWQAAVRRPVLAANCCQLLGVGGGGGPGNKGLLEKGDLLIGEAVHPPLMGRAPHKLWHLCTALPRSHTYVSGGGGP